MWCRNVPWLQQRERGVGAHRRTEIDGKHAVQGRYRSSHFIVLVKSVMRGGVADIVGEQSFLGGPGDNNKQDKDSEAIASQETR